jgi:hypothetical protein
MKKNLILVILLVTYLGMFNARCQQFCQRILSIFELGKNEFE